MKVGELVSPLVHAAHDLDTRWHRVWQPHVRNVVFDARTAMEYATMAPVHRHLLSDARVRTCLISSERPHRVGEIFRDAPGEALVLSPRAAMMKRFDVYVAADLVWATLPRGTRRVQMFHGVAGKWSQVYDRPGSSMRHWDRLFFINRRRLQNYIASGAIDCGSSAIRLIGMPKTDCLVDGSLSRNGVLEANGMDPALTTVLYAPTWTRFSSLNAMGQDVVGGLIEAGYRVLVKLHENSLDRAFENSGGVDWVARLKPILAKGHGHLITSADASRWLVATDVLVTDHSSIGLEYLLLNRPLIRIAMPQLLKSTNVAEEYVDLIAAASTTVENAAGVVAAVDRAVSYPAQLSSARRAVAAELFHGPGTATDRATRELYALMELDAPACVHSVAPVHDAAICTADRVLSLDVVVPTYNRAALLPRALESLLAADQPDRLHVRVTVVDNRSTDDTRAIVESFMPRFGGQLQYVYESRPGRSHALNAGIAATRGDLVGMIDDDEEVDRSWLLTIAAAFEDPTTHFIGGPYVPRWGGERPVWLGAAYGAVIGYVECGQATQQFGPGCAGMLMGGNAVIRRSVLERVGPYSVDLGRTPDGRLMSCEDEDMFIRLLAIGARGFYRPDLVIHHYVPPERLTKQYFRRWCFWRGVSQGVIDKRRPASVPYLFGVPRYMVGAAVRGMIDTVRPLFGQREPVRTFKNELAWWDLAGFFYGKHVYRARPVSQDHPSNQTDAPVPTSRLMRGSVAKSHCRRSSLLTGDETP